MLLILWLITVTVYEQIKFRVFTPNNLSVSHKCLTISKQLHWIYFGLVFEFCLIESHKAFFLILWQVLWPLMLLQSQKVSSVHLCGLKGRFGLVLVYKLLCDLQGCTHHSTVAEFQGWAKRFYDSFYNLSPLIPPHTILAPCRCLWWFPVYYTLKVFVTWQLYLSTGDGETCCFCHDTPSVDNGCVQVIFWPWWDFWWKGPATSCQLGVLSSFILTWVFLLVIVKSITRQVSQIE